MWLFISVSMNMLKYKLNKLRYRNLCKLWFQDFTVHIGLHLSWRNDDLISKIRTIAYEFEYLDFDAQNMEKVWVPDIYFPNEKKASIHNIMMANKMLRLYKDSTVRYIVR